MARLRAECCCGSSIEARSVSFFAAPVITQDWWKLHALCATAWQRERGLDSRISFDDQDREEP